MRHPFEKTDNQKFQERAAAMIEAGHRPIGVVAFAEKGWSEDLIKKHGTIYTLCWFDASEATNLCEIRSSYELHPYGVEGTIEQPEDLPDDERLEDIWRETGHEPFYVHCSTIERLEGRRMVLLETGFALDATEADIDESMQANPPYNHTMKFDLKSDSAAAIGAGLEI
jgi:hypothetical protein